MTSRLIVGAVPSVGVRETTRDGKSTRVYRRPVERWAMFVCGIAIFGGVGLQLAPAIWHGRDHGAATTVALAVLVAVFVVLAGGWFMFGRRFGVEVDEDGVRNVAATGTSFVSWADVAGFAIERYAATSSCVAVERRDGSRTRLTALARWTRWERALEPYRDALTRELEAHQDGES
jgi:hypothetical protein